MPIRVEVRGGSSVLQQRYLHKLADRLKDRGKGLVKASNAVARVWEKNFRTGGSAVGGWAQLAEATLNNRARQGMPSGPILIKYGALKSVVTEGFMEANGSGQWSRNDPYSDHSTRGRLTISKGVAKLSAHGWKIANQYGHSNGRGSSDVPARPFWFVDRTVQAAARGAIEEWLEDEVLD